MEDEESQLDKIISLLEKIVGLMEPEVGMKAIDFPSEDIKTEDIDPKHWDLPTTAKSIPGVEGTIDQKHPDPKSHFLSGVCPRCKSDKIEQSIVDNRPKQRSTLVNCEACGWSAEIQESL